MKLVLSSPILPQESLLSYLARLATLNRYPDSKTILEFISDDIEQYSSNWFAALSSITGVKDSELYESSIHFFANVIVPPGTDIPHIRLSCGERPVFPSMRIPNGLHSEKRLSFCPICIQENPYHRLYWVPEVSLICPIHRCFLFSECPSCHGSIAISSIHSKRCYQCGQNLIDKPENHIAKESPELISQAVIPSWFGYPIEPDKLLNAQLPNTSPRVLLALVLGLSQSLRRPGKTTSSSEGTESLDDAHDTEDISQVPLSIRIDNLTTSFTLLTNWPIKFIEFLDGYRSRDDFQTSWSVYSDFPYLGYELLEGKWKYPAFDFLQQVFEDFLVRHYQRVSSIENLRRYKEVEVFQARFVDVSLAQAARMLGVSKDEVFELITQGQLWRRINSNYELTSPPWVPRDEVLLLIYEWKQEFTIDLVAERLGTTKIVVRRLIDLNLLETEFHDSIEGTYVITGRALNRFRHLLHSSLGNTDGPLLTLQEATMRLSPLDYDEAKVIEAVIRKEFRARNGLLLNRLQIQRSDVEELRKKLIARFALEILQPIAIKRGVDPLVLQKWIRAGVIHLEKDYHLIFTITDEEWDRFNYEYLSAHQAAKFLDIPVSTIERWVKMGRLHEVGLKDYGIHTFLFRKKDVEIFSPGNLLEKQDIIQEYSISQKQLSDLIANGELTPVSGPGVDRFKQNFFSRADIERILALHTRGDDSDLMRLSES